jgi:hypothetical protein
MKRSNDHTKAAVMFVIAAVALGGIAFATIKFGGATNKSTVADVKQTKTVADQLTQEEALAAQQKSQGGERVAQDTTEATQPASEVQWTNNQSLEATAAPTPEATAQASDNNEDTPSTIGVTANKRKNTSETISEQRPALYDRDVKADEEARASADGGQ